MGTVVDYTVVAVDRNTARDAVARAHDEMERVSRLLWEKDTLSVIFAFNLVRDGVEAPPEVAGFLERARSLASETGGAFDPTVKPVLDLYGFDRDAPRPPDQRAIDSSMRLVGYDRFRINDTGSVTKDVAGLTLTVGGVAKGYAVDRAVAALQRSGIRDAIVNAGGDLYCLGSRGGEPWRVGVRDPDDASAVAAVLQIRAAAVATSGDYQQYYDHSGIRYHHILSPFDGTPARGLRSATVVAASAERADALATALFVLGRSDGLKLVDSLPDAEGLVIDSAGTMHRTDGMARYIADDPSATSSRSGTQQHVTPPSAF